MDRFSSCAGCYLRSNLGCLLGIHHADVFEVFEGVLPVLLLGAHVLLQQAENMTGLQKTAGRRQLVHKDEISPGVFPQMPCSSLTSKNSCLILSVFESLYKSVMCSRTVTKHGGLKQNKKKTCRGIYSCGRSDKRHSCFKRKQNERYGDE